MSATMPATRSVLQSELLDPHTLAKLQGLELRAAHIVEGYVAGLHRSGELLDRSRLITGGPEVGAQLEEGHVTECMSPERHRPVARCPGGSAVEP